MDESLNGLCKILHFCINLYSLHGKRETSYAKIRSQTS
ncbi:hypothetical protein [Inovirus D_HF5_61]|nr:hypothetical protein [Inovirus D_HF5_61]